MSRAVLSRVEAAGGFLVRWAGWFAVMAASVFGLLFAIPFAAAVIWTVGGWIAAKFGPGPIFTTIVLIFCAVAAADIAGQKRL